MWLYLLGLLLGYAWETLDAALSIDGCAELFELAFAQMGMAEEYSGSVDPALLETIDRHCFTQAT